MKAHKLVLLSIATCLSLVAYFQPWRSGSSEGGEQNSIATGQPNSHSETGDFANLRAPQDSPRLHDKTDNEPIHVSPASNPDAKDPLDSPSDLSDEQLGLDLDRPWREIDMLAYMYHLDEMSEDVAARLEHDPYIIERRKRVLKVWNQDEAYWSERFGLDAIDRAIRTLKDFQSTRAELFRDMGQGMSYLKFWLLTNANFLSEAPLGSDSDEGMVVGRLSLNSKLYHYRYPEGSFPFLDEWWAYQTSYSNRAAEVLEKVAEDFPYDLRAQLLGELETARVQQLNAVPQNPKH